MPRNPDPLFFSTDGSQPQVCPTRDRYPCACPAVVGIVPAETRLGLHLDKKGRGGKAVTVVFDLPPQPDYFIHLVKRLKAHSGTGVP